MKPKRRFTIGRLLIAIGVCAVAFAVIRSGQEVAASAAFALAVVAILSASLAALLRHRPYWLGFAAFGWASLVLSFGPWSKETPVPRPIVTSVLLELYPYVGFQHSTGMNTAFNEASGVFAVAGGKPAIVSIAYLQIGHSALALVVAPLGGLATHRLASRRPRD